MRLKKPMSGSFEKPDIHPTFPTENPTFRMMASMHDWKPTDSTGRRQRAIRPVDGFTILVEAGKLCIVKTVARSREHFPFGVSGSKLCRPPMPLDPH
jgi:hypothetical protein